MLARRRWRRRGGISTTAEALSYAGLAGANPPCALPSPQSIPPSPSVPRCFSFFSFFWTLLHSLQWVHMPYPASCRRPCRQHPLTATSDNEWGGALWEHCTILARADARVLGPHSGCGPGSVQAASLANNKHWQQETASCAYLPHWLSRRHSPLRRVAGAVWLYIVGGTRSSPCPCARGIASVAASSSTTPWNGATSRSPGRLSHITHLHRDPR